MTYHARLDSLGFKLLPDLDPCYFDYHDGVGYYALVNDEQEIYYHGYTYNASDMLTSVNDLILGRKRNRAVALIAALKNTDVQDWMIYFKPCEKSSFSQDEIVQAMDTYTQIRKWSSRQDENELLTLWYVEDMVSGFKRLVYIPSDQDVSDAITRYQILWRKAYHSALRDGSIRLNQYYNASEQQAQSCSCWMSGDLSRFKTGQLTEVGGLVRRDAISRTKYMNNNYTSEYFAALEKVKVREKEVLGLED